MNPEEELRAAVRQAINDSEGAAHSPDHLLDVQAAAAVGAMLRSGWIKQAGWEYAVKRGDVTLEVGFNTEDQARVFVERRWGALEFEIERRPVGVWEPLEGTSDTIRKILP